MKKTEAVVKLKELISKHIAVDSCDDKAVTELLDGIQKEIGMLPPSTYLEMFKVYDNCWEVE